jgi:hypothetical protein
MGVPRLTFAMSEQAIAHLQGSASGLPTRSVICYALLV